MTDTLTESFCERCGTRYEFKAPTRLNPLRKTRGFVGGLRNYLTSQDALSDAIGDAMRTEEDGLAHAQLDAFHESFNFCINCRQYTCVNCWNDQAGRCRTCAPIPGTDDLAERLAASFGGPAVGARPGMMQDTPPGHLELDVWPMSDLPIEQIGGNGDGTEVWPEAEFSEPEPMVAEVEPEPEPEPVVAEVEPEPEPLVAEVEPEPEPVVAEVEPEPEPEPMVAEVEPEPEPEPVVAEVEPEPEPLVADVEPEPEPVVAEVEPEPVIAEVEPEPIAAGIEIEPVRQPLRVVAWDEDAAFELIEAEPEPVTAEFEPFVVETEPEPVLAEVEPEPVVAEDEPEPVVAEVEPEPVVAEVEPEPVVAEVEPEPEPAIAEVEPEPEPVVAEVEPEPVVAEVEPEPKPEPPRLRVPPIRETILPFPTRPAAAPAEEEQPGVAAAADSPELAARRAQLDDLGLGGPDSSADEGAPQPLPYRSRGAAVTQTDLARAEVMRRSFWEASAREVASAGAQVGVQSCGHCGLSLSANARFCRRCGTPQAQSA